MSGEPTQRDALLRLGASTAEAIAQVLEMLAPGEVTRGEVSVLGSGANPFEGVASGSVAAGVSYIGGVTGANVFLAAPASARALASKMGAVPGDEDDAALSELELSAIAEAANQMMAAAANAIGMVLGHEVEIAPPLTRVLDGPGSAEELFGSAPHATATTFLVDGAPCRLIQLIPSAFVVRIARALDAIDSADAEGAAHRHEHGDDEHTLGLAEALSGMRLRVWAELGRTQLALGDALEIPLGAVIELDRATESPVDLFVNGLRFARGRLMVSDEGRWVFELDELMTGETTPAPALATP